MASHIGANEAARILGVSKPTLYAYVSRGLVGRSTAADGRSSLYQRDEIEHLASRGRWRSETRRAAIDVEISSSITELNDDRISYRGHDAATIARTRSFEQVAELLWTGTLPESDVTWKVDRELLARCRRVVDAAAPTAEVVRLALASTALAGRSTDSGADAARTLLSIAPSVLGGLTTGTVAHRLASAWRRRPPPELVAAIDRALVLLADHELATSTLAVRVACSVRADPCAAIAAGLNVVSGALHGAASAAVVSLLESAEQVGADRAVNAWLTSGARLPGVGHSVYRTGDPRLTPLLEAVDQIAGGEERLDVVHEVLAMAGRRSDQLPNVDLGLGALLFVGRLPADAGLFAVARIAGWGAHYDEELGEHPLRFRGVTTHR